MSVAFASCHLTRSRWDRWSTQEDEVVRARFKTAPISSLAEQLGRSERSIRLRASKIGALKVPPWTKADERRLQMLWGEKSLRQIAYALGRSQGACYGRMFRLTGTVVPAGSGRLWAEAERTGFHHSLLRRILAWAGVEPIPVTTLRRRDRKYDGIQYDQADVDEAIEKWMACEVINRAAKRHGLRWHVLVKILEESGVDLPPRPRGKSTWRVPSTLIDHVVGEWRSKEMAPVMRVLPQRDGRGRWSPEANQEGAAACQ